MKTTKRNRFNAEALADGLVELCHAYLTWQAVGLVLELVLRTRVSLSGSSIDNG